jgi:hydroxymethylglutaryl-CoA reductase
MNKKPKQKKIDGFSKLKRSARIKKISEWSGLSQKELLLINSHQTLPYSLAENLIENFVCYYQMPIGVAVNFCIDQRDFIIPMSVEETSVIAAASKTAKWIKETGEISTETKGCFSIGQIQIAKVKDITRLQKLIQNHKQALIHEANNKVAKGMVKRGGGVGDIQLRHIPRSDGFNMAVIHILVNTCDSLGANLINQICEYLREPIEKLSDEKVTMCILSNLNDTKITQATITLDHVDPELGEAIAEASLFAQLDPYRAVTNNKGVLNGMDAVAIATGNDWRALEAGVHAYAARDGQYSSITRWEYKNHQLQGSLAAPLNVATVGGVTAIHPIAALCLKMLNISKAEELSRIIAAVGLVQNLGALRALTTEGIVNGHMKLHISNLCLAAGAQREETSKLTNLLQKQLSEDKRITLNDVVNLLTQMRQSE